RGTTSGCQIPPAFPDRGTSRVEALVGAAGRSVDPPGDRPGLRLECVQKPLETALGIWSGQCIAVHPRDRDARPIGGAIRHQCGPSWSALGNVYLDVLFLRRTAS